jgi:Mn-dependent DtxR family transcriptional regulator
MSAANPNTVLKYMQDIKESKQGRACSIPLGHISAALGVPEPAIQEMLNHLRERRLVHEVSRGSWCTGAGFGR